jgi:hypothetical protein
MKKYILILVFLAISYLSFSQESTHVKLVLGIGNQKIDTYFKVIDFLNDLRDVKVINTCETHRIIVINKSVSFYKDDMEFLKYLTDNIDGLIVNYKDEKILTKECFSEINKQP